MTTRERVLAVFSGHRPDRLPNVEFGYWEETLTRWHGEGLPEEVRSDASAEVYFGLEGVTVFAEIPARNGLFPLFETTVLRNDGDRRIIRDAEGNICEILTEHSSMPRYLEFGLRTRSDWDRLKAERLDPWSEGRIGDIPAAITNARSAGKPVFLHCGALYGWLRNWMGVEGLSYALMSERAWVEEMMDHLTALTLTLVDRVLPAYPVDLAWWWEDMCYNRGPLMSPRMFGEMLVPRYRRVTEALRRHGVTINVLDSDGRIHELVPGWLDAGINCMFPLESAHTDSFLLRKTYGDRLLLMGGVDKRALIEGHDGIDREIERLRPLVEQGRFIPCVDHRVPADVSLDSYRYYLERKGVLLEP